MSSISSLTAGTANAMNASNLYTDEDFDYSHQSNQFPNEDQVIDDNQFEYNQLSGRQIQDMLPPAFMHTNAGLQPEQMLYSIDQNGQSDANTFLAQSTHLCQTQSAQCNTRQPMTRLNSFQNTSFDQDRMGSPVRNVSLKEYEHLSPIRKLRLFEDQPSTRNSFKENRIQTEIKFNSYCQGCLDKFMTSLRSQMMTGCSEICMANPCEIQSPTRILRRDAMFFNGGEIVEGSNISPRSSFRGNLEERRTDHNLNNLTNIGLFSKPQTHFVGSDHYRAQFEMQEFDQMNQATYTKSDLPCTSLHSECQQILLDKLRAMMGIVQNNDRNQQTYQDPSQSSGYQGIQNTQIFSIATVASCNTDTQDARKRNKKEKTDLMVAKSKQVSNAGRSFDQDTRDKCKSVLRWFQKLEEIKKYTQDENRNDSKRQISELLTNAIDMCSQSRIEKLMDNDYARKLFMSNFCCVYQKKLNDGSACRYQKAKLDSRQPQEKRIAGLQNAFNFIVEIAKNQQTKKQTKSPEVS